MVAFFQTLATVIPVLLVAGMLNPALLREYSKRRETAAHLSRYVIAALVSTTFCLIAVLFAIPFDRGSLTIGGDEWIWLQVMLLLFGVIGFVGLFCSAYFVVTLATYSLHRNPHPDRLKSDIEAAEKELSELRRRHYEAAGEDAEGE